MKKSNQVRMLIVSLFASVIFTHFFFPRDCMSQAPQANWIMGPQTVDLGNNVAQIELGENYIFAGADDTKKLMEHIGNPISNNEVGLIAPRAEEGNWYIVFEHSKVGYIRDDDKDSIDSEAILKNIKNATDRANKTREENGFPALHVLGWHEEPHYDVNSNNLVWAILAESSGNQVVNYNVRLLGRHGYMSVVLVTDPDTLDAYKADVDSIIANFSYKQGKSYAEYVQGDKLAKYGLTALIAGGAGAAVVKTGILNALLKYIKVIAIAVIGFFAALWKRIKGIFRSEETYSVEKVMSMDEQG